jgi:hypothetical protein
MTTKRRVRWLACQRQWWPPDLSRAHAQAVALQAARVHRRVDGAPYSEIGARLPCPDVHLPHGWNLNQARVPAPAIPLRGHACCQKILRRRVHLLSNLLRDPVYALDSPMWSAPDGLASRRPTRRRSRRCRRTASSSSSSRGCCVSAAQVFIDLGGHALSIFFLFLFYV